MLTGPLLRVRYARDKIVPRYINPREEAHLAAAQLIIDLFRRHQGETRGELEAELKEVFGDDPGQFVLRGLTKLLEDRSEFEVQSDVPPDKLRDAVFASSFRARKAGSFARAAAIDEVAAELAIPPEAVEDGLFADLKAEQRLTRVDAISPERLLDRYNVALAQAALLR